jgi:predicted esterase
MRILSWTFGEGAPDPRQRQAEEIVVRVPSGAPQTGGWPVIVFLHGAGERTAAYAARTALAADHGFAGVAPSGPMGTTHAGRSWSGDLATTNDCVRVALGQCEDSHQVDRGRIYLCGFSQGATHAIGLLLSRPEEYRGALALSPGEGPALPAVPPLVLCPRPLYVAYGEKEYRVFRKKAQRCAALWRRAKWPCLLETHPGAYHFPADWDRRFPRLVQWLETAARQTQKEPRSS